MSSVYIKKGTTRKRTGRRTTQKKHTGVSIASIQRDYYIPKRSRGSKLNIIVSKR